MVRTAAPEGHHRARRSAAQTYRKLAEDRIADGLLAPDDVRRFGRLARKSRGLVRALWIVRLTQGRAPIGTRTRWCGARRQSRRRRLGSSCESARPDAHRARTRAAR